MGEKHKIIIFVSVKNDLGEILFKCEVIKGDIFYTDSVTQNPCTKS